MPGGGFKDFLFSALPGEDLQFDSYFSDGLVQPQTKDVIWLSPHSFYLAILSAGDLGRGEVTSHMTQKDQKGWIGDLQRLSL